MKRNISKRFELNSKEAELLRIKSRQTGLSEGEYLRELICNSQPVEAPPRQFYEAMGKVNDMITQLGNLASKVSDKPDESDDHMQEISVMQKELRKLLVEIKEIVSSARYYASSAYDWWLHQTEMARKEGKAPPKMEEYEPRDRSNDILDLTDPNLGWRALGVEKPDFSDSKEKRR